MWLVPTSSFEPRASELRDEASWPAFDVAAVFGARVEPGEVGTIGWTLRMPAPSSGTIEEGFQLTASDGTMLRCPSPFVGVAVRAERGDTTEEPNGGAAASVDGVADQGAGCSCRVTSTSSHGADASLVALVGLGLGARRRRR
jgi:MYXO-CTERM domain-containing protein